jgi:NAD(P)H-hydrate repair Nnr-like enzyme with NAD(P)H-hydrate dehydratase domain
MNRRPPRSREAVLVILRDTLQKLELNPTTEIDTPRQVEFKRILRVRIADLEAESAAMLRLVSIKDTHSSKTEI